MMISGKDTSEKDKKDTTDTKDTKDTKDTSVKDYIKAMKEDNDRKDKMLEKILLSNTKLEKSENDKPKTNSDFMNELDKILGEE